MMVQHGLDSCDSEWGQVRGFCKHDTLSSGFHKTQGITTLGYAPLNA